LEFSFWEEPIDFDGRDVPLNKYQKIFGSRHLNQFPLRSQQT
jgi:hypothetical protein